MGTSALFQHLSTFSALFTIFWCMVPAVTPWLSPIFGENTLQTFF